MFSKELVIFFIVFLAAAAAGIIWPAPSRYLNPIMAPAMMTILFLSFLKISPQMVWEAMKQYPGRLSLLVVIKLIILPVAVYALAIRLVPDYALGLLLLAGVSTAVSAPFFVQLVGGNMALVLVMAVVTSVLVPFSLPAVVKLMAGHRIVFDPLAMIRFLAAIVFLPLAAAALCRRILPIAARWLEAHSFVVSLPFFAVINLAVFGRYAPIMRARLDHLAVGTILICVLSGLAAAAGLAVLRSSPGPDRIASAASLAWVNNVLVIILAVELNEPTAALLSTLYMFPFLFLMFPLARLRR